MSIQDGYVCKKVTINTQDGLEEKVDRLMTMISKLTAQDNEQNKQFKCEIFQTKRTGQKRNFYDRHDRNYQNRYRSNGRDNRISFSGRMPCGQDYKNRPRYDQKYRNDFRRGDFRPNQIYRGQKYKGEYKRNFSNKNIVMEWTFQV